MNDRLTEFDRIGKDVLQIVQAEAREWRRKAYPDTAGIMYQALGVGEECGELQHAVLKYMQGIRGYDREKTRSEVADAIGDIVIYACGVADTLDIDVRKAVAQAWMHVKERNITQGSDAGASETPETHAHSKGFTAGVDAAKAPWAHRNGCAGCNISEGTYPDCWTDKDIREDQQRIRNLVTGEFDA